MIARSSPAIALILAACATASGAMDRGEVSRPVVFEANRGQADPSVSFVARSCDGMILLNAAGAILKRSDVTLQMRFANAREVPATGDTKLDAPIRYLRPDHEIRAEAFAAVRYRELYRGVDVLFHVNAGQLEYDLHVRPGADVSPVRVRFEGASSVRIENGELRVSAGANALVQHAPIAFQMVRGARRPVDVRYELDRGGGVRFTLGSYDNTRELIIDPVLSYSTYISGSNSDAANGIAVDRDGNMIIAGTTSSPDLPTSNAILPWSGGVTDAFVMKLSADGLRLLYATYLGSPSDDTATAVAIDGDGNAYVTGRVSRPNLFPDIYDDKRAYVVKLDRSGGLVYSVTVAGTGGDEGHAIAVDGKGQAYITGYAAGGYSRGYPVVNGFQQATGTQIGFVTMLDAAGRNILYSTNTTGNGPTPSMGNGIAVDANGFVYVTGSAAAGMLTTSGAFQSTYQGDVSDAFAAKIDPRKSGTNSLVWLTYLGSAGTDAAHAIAVETGGSVWIAGSTNSSAAGRPFPTTSSAAQPGITFDACRDDGLGFPTFCEDAFIARLDADGSRLLYSTLMGGKGTDIANGIALDSAGRAWVTGRAGSTFPISSDAYQTRARSGIQAFVAEIDGTKSGPASAPWSSYLGGSGNDIGQAVALGPGGSNVFVAGFATSTDFPLKSPLISVGGGNGSSAFVTRFAVEGAANPTLNAVNAASYTSGIAPGSLFAIFGPNLSSQPVSAPSLPLKTALGGVVVTVNGVPAPLHYVSPGQINAQAPFSTGAGAAQVVVTADGTQRASVSATVGATAPGIFQFSGTRAVATNDDFRLNTSTAPARAGHWITVYLTGQGLFDRSVEDGAGAPLSPLAYTAASTTASVGGLPAKVLFSGGAPGFAGVTQVNVEIPAGVGAGDQPLIVSIGGVASNTTIITVAP